MYDWGRSLEKGLISSKWGYIEHINDQKVLVRESISQQYQLSNNTLRHLHMMAICDRAYQMPFLGGFTIVSRGRCARPQRLVCPHVDFHLDAIVRTSGDADSAAPHTHLVCMSIWECVCVCGCRLIKYSNRRNESRVHAHVLRICFSPRTLCHLLRGCLHANLCTHKRHACVCVFHSGGVPARLRNKLRYSWAAAIIASKPRSSITWAVNPALPFGDESVCAACAAALRSWALGRAHFVRLRCLYNIISTLPTERPCAQHTNIHITTLHLRMGTYWTIICMRLKWGFHYQNDCNRYSWMEHRFGL